MATKKAAGKSISKAAAEGRREAKSKKAPSEKGESAKFEKKEEKAYAAAKKTQTKRGKK